MAEKDISIEFIPDHAFRLWNSGRYVDLQASLGTKERLTDRERAEFMGAATEYLDAIRQGDPKEAKTLPFKGRPRLVPVPAEVERGDDVAFKYTTDEGLAYWRQGSIRICPPSYYRTIENAAARDEYEGYGAIDLQDSGGDVVFVLRGGYASLVLCLARAAPRASRSLMKSRFGPRLLKISGLRDLSRKIVGKVGANQYRIHDVVYTDAKMFTTQREEAQALRDMIGSGPKMSQDTLLTINERYFDLICELAEVPTTFCKPQSFYSEQERRVAFLMPQHCPECRIVDIGDEIDEHLEVLE